ncbi:MAG: dienelactone hydrolase family protein [Sphingobacteriales bacterium]|nr:dienelactone hydrolase family protein [Sphingobacteriales bacterium]
MNKYFLSLAAASLVFFSSCNNQTGTQKEPDMKEPKLKVESITYSPDGIKDSLVLDGYIAWDENIVEKRPVVLVVHEWWGLNDYIKRRVRELAGLGYIAMAVDFYGNGKRADNPTDAGNLSGPFYKDPDMAKQRFDAALKAIRSYSQADTSKIAAIGYCFGGTQVLNMANLGEDLAGVVSFHGGLQVVTPGKDKLKAQVLVCHGAADPFVPQAQVDQFRKQMDSVGAKYLFKAYADATHAFSNPDATANGKKFNLPIAYNAAADSASWNDMKAFFGTIFK